MFVRPAVVALAAASTLLLAATPAAACPFCSAQGQTLSGEVAQADLILYGTLQNAKQTDGGLSGTTDLVVETVVKPHDFVKGKTVVSIPRYVQPTTPGGKFLVFCYVADGKLDPYRGEEVKPDSKLPEYVKGAIAVKTQPPVARLRYFFDFLESPELAIGADAYVEFSYADYKEVQALARTLPPDVLTKWLVDPNTRSSRYGLYGLMLGHCGRPEHATQLAKLLADPTKAVSSGLDGLLAGYTLLDPKAGWAAVMGYVSNPKADFASRYAALKTARFFWEYRPDVVAKTDVLAAMKELLGQSDMADLPVEDLRKWGVWDMTGDILALAGKESHNAIPIVKRSILKFALTAAPHVPAAGAFVAAARKENPTQVEFIEEVIRDEQKPAPPSTPDPAKNGVKAAAK